MIAVPSVQVKWWGDNDISLVPHVPDGGSVMLHSAVTAKLLEKDGEPAHHMVVTVVADGSG